LRPGPPGRGVIAGAGAHMKLDLAAIRDVLSKSIGTQNPINLVKATMEGLEGLRRPEQVAELRGISVKEVLGVAEKPTNGAKGAADGEKADEPPVAEAAPAPETVAEQATDEDSETE